MIRMLLDFTAFFSSILKYVYTIYIMASVIQEFSGAKCIRQNPNTAKFSTFQTQAGMKHRFSFHLRHSIIQFLYLVTYGNVGNGKFYVSIKRNLNCKPHEIKLPRSYLFQK